MKYEIVQYPRAKTEMYITTTSSPLKVGSLGGIHIHSDFEILYLTKGALKCYVENEISYAKEGDIVFINSRVPHRCEVLEDGTGFVTLQFKNPAKVVDSLKYLIRYLSKINFPHHIFKKEEEGTAYLSDKVKDLLFYAQFKDRVHDYLMIAKKYEIVAFLHQNNFIEDELSLVDAKKINAIMPIIEFVHTNYQENISLNDISNAVHLHGNYICKLFKKTVGITVIDYLNYVRTCKAESLLNSGLSVAEVSDLTGFSTPSYFNKVFKKYFSVAPAKYKQLINTGNTEG